MDKTANIYNGMYDVMHNWYLKKGSHTYVAQDDLTNIDNYFMNGIP